jgi:hypothetical protein
VTWDQETKYVDDWSHFHFLVWRLAILPEVFHDFPQSMLAKLVCTYDYLPIDIIQTMQLRKHN